MPTPPLRGATHIFDLARTAEQVLDDTHFPVLTLRTKGSANIAMMTEMYAIRDPLLRYAKENGLCTVLVSDLSDLQAPDAVTRRKASELAAKVDAPFVGNHLATIYLVSNPLMRGIVTAVSWVAGDAMVPNIFASNLDGCLKELHKVYAKAGQDMPNFPEDYSFPAYQL